jgi:hypothetical protein
MSNFVTTWLERSEELYAQGTYDGATAAALIGLLTWLAAEWVTDDETDDQEPPECEQPPWCEERRQADQLERLVWDAQ